MPAWVTELGGQVKALKPTVRGGLYGLVLMGVPKALEVPLAKAQPPTEGEIKTALDYFPEKHRKELAEILDFYKEIYPTHTTMFCADAAESVRQSLEERFKQNPRDRERFKDFEFSFDSYRHPINLPAGKQLEIQAPTNYTTVTAGDKTIYLYTGSDRIYPWLDTPRISPYQQYRAIY